MGKNNQKFTQEFVFQYYKDKGCTLLDEYKNSTTKMNYICKCGNLRCTTFGKFKQQKHGCKICAGMDMYTQQEVEDIFKEHNCKLISVYTGANDNLIYICECGSESTTTLSNFKKGKRCVACGLNKLSEQFKHNIEFIKQFFIDNNCTPLFEEYYGVHIPLKYICECGNESQIAFADFQNGKRCCACRVERIVKTMYKNNTQQCSIQQKYIHELLGGKLNFPFNSSTLDIAFPDINVYIEYDGGGHDLSVKLGSLTADEFKKKEVDRRYALYRRGWKEIKIISRKDYLPTDDDIILEMFSFAIKYLQNHSWITFDIDNNLVKTSQFDQQYNYGQLKRIKSDNIS
jgi:hypothetical protein